MPLLRKMNFDTRLDEEIHIAIRAVAIPLSASISRVAQDHPNSPAKHGEIETSRLILARHQHARAAQLDPQVLRLLNRQGKGFSRQLLYRSKGLRSNVM